MCVLVVFEGLLIIGKYMVNILVACGIVSPIYIYMIC